MFMLWHDEVGSVLRCSVILTLAGGGGGVVVVVVVVP
jgi:hypothetical protein